MAIIERMAAYEGWPLMRVPLYYNNTVLQMLLHCDNI